MNTSSPIFQSSREMSEAESYGSRGDAESASRVIWTPPDVYRLLAALAQRMTWLIIAPIIGLCATTGFLLYKGPTYDINAQLMVRVGPELAAPATLVPTQSQAMTPIAKTIEDITDEVQIMSNPEIVEQAVEELGVDFFYGEAPAVTFLQKVKKAVKDAIKYVKELIRGLLIKIGLLPKLTKLEMATVLLQNNLSIEHVTRSDVIHLNIGYPDPYLGQAFLEKFIEIYLKKRAKVYDADKVAQFFEGELATIAGNLTNAEEDYTRLSAENAGWSIEDQRSMGVKRREALRAELEDAISIADVAKVKVTEIDAQLATLPALEDSSSSTARSNLFDQLRVKEIELGLQLEAEKKLSGVRSQKVQVLEQQLAQLQATLANVPAYVKDANVKSLNPLRQSLEVQRADAVLLVEQTQRRIENLRQQIERIENELRDIDRTSLELARKSRQIERLRTSQIAFQKAKDDARITDLVSAASISNVVVISEPQGSIAPVKPRVLRTFLIAIIFSLIAMSGVILVIDAMRPKVRSNTDILAFTEDPTIVRAVS